MAVYPLHYLCDSEVMLLKLLIYMYSMFVICFIKFTSVYLICIITIQSSSEETPPKMYINLYIR